VECSEPSDDTPHGARGPGQRLHVEREDILGGYELHRVEDEAVLPEREKEDVLAANPLDGAEQRTGSQYRRSLFRKFDKQDSPNRRIRLGAPEHAPVHCQEQAARYADPPIHGSERRDPHQAHAPFFVSNPAGVRSGQPHPPF
jgi:hypothetical protein